MRVPRRQTSIWRLAGLLAICLVLAVAPACGATGSAPSEETDGGSHTEEAATSAETTASEKATSPGNGAPQLPATVTGADGREVTVQDTNRIVPLNGDIAEIIFALGLGDNVVGTDVSATYPEEARNLPKFGYQRQLNAEGILSLRPSVIVGTEEAGPPEVIEQLRNSGTSVVIIEDPPTLEAPGLKIRTVAAALGISGRGEELALETEQEIEEARELADEATTEPSVMFLYVRGAGTQMIGGQGTPSNALITAARGMDAGAQAGITDFRPLTPEALAQAQPETLLMLSAGLQSVGGVAGLLQIPGVAGTPAGQERRVLDYDDLYLLGMGPRTGQALRDLVLGLHPELGG